MILLFFTFSVSISILLCKLGDWAPYNRKFPPLLIGLVLKPFKGIRRSPEPAVGIGHVAEAMPMSEAIHDQTLVLLHKHVVILHTTMVESQLHVIAFWANLVA